MSDTVTIMPIVCQHPAQLAIYRAAFRSHKATCDSKLIAIFNENHTKEHTKFASLMREELNRLGYDWVHYHDEFNLNKIYNYGLDRTESEFVVFSIADTLFLGDWLTPLKTLLATGKYHSVQGVSRENGDGYFCYYDKAKEQVGGVLETTEPCGYHFVMRRDKGFRWNEEVGIYYPDIFYREELARIGEVCAVCAHSHVEHLGAPIAYLNTHHGPSWDMREVNEQKVLDKYRAMGKS